MASRVAPATLLALLFLSMACSAQMCMMPSSGSLFRSVVQFTYGNYSTNLAPSVAPGIVNLFGLSHFDRAENASYVEVLFDNRAEESLFEVIISDGMQ